jgi:CDP-glycerol glycerophosphotransferase
LSDRLAPASPDVTVVVIAYNDAANLPAAVGSVLDQTLANLEVVVVDDASTDGTAAEADRLAARDPRVRVVRLPTNSGGCSRPRNTGLEAARAPYVMFLDSDDVLQRHACKNLWAAAETSGADVVAGLAERVERGTGRRSRWWGRLYTEHAVHDGIAGCAEMLHDTICTNKLYRRAFLDENRIRFPEGIHYEDLLFTTEVYCSARRIAIIPNLVYRWMVAPDTATAASDAPRLSITNRRAEIRNLRDRITVHRLIDEYLGDRGLAELRTVKDVKFMRHDLRLYLYDLPHRDDVFRRAFLDLTAPYVATIGEAALERCDDLDRIAAFMIRQRDMDQLLRVVDMIRHGRKLSADLVVRDGRVYWCEDHLDTEDGRRQLDVTDMRLDTVPFVDQPLYTRLTELQVDEDTLTVSGVTTNLLRRIQPGDPLKLALSFRGRGQRTRHEVPVPEVTVGPDRISWSATVPISTALPVKGRGSGIWDVTLRTSWKGVANLSPLTVLYDGAPDVEGRLIPVHPRLRLVVGNHLACYRTRLGNLAFRLVNTNPVGAAPVRLVRRYRRSLPVRAARFGYRLLKGEIDAARAYPFFKRLPIRKGTVVFESHLGLQYSDSPKYIYEALRQERPDLQVTWAYADSPAGFPSGARLARRGSLAYYHALARAEFWVDNQGFPRTVTKRPGTTYLQTWHGTPLKLMGWDEPALAALSPDEKREHQAMIERWDHLVVPNEYFVETFVKAYNYGGNLLRTGYPRNDILAGGSDPDAVRRVRERLGLPLDRRIVLYAPTFRDAQRRAGQRFRLHLELGPMSEALGEDHFVLLRTHYLDRLQLPRSHAGFARDVTGEDDVSELLLAADVLITDYSSLMFDYANLRRPLIFFTFDYADYVAADRGTYFDLASDAPGPLVSTTEEVIECLRRGDALLEDHAEKYDRWVARFCEYETGHASSDVVKHVFGQSR